MKAALLATSAIFLLCGIPGANAQNAAPGYDNSIHQSAGDRDSRGTPKYYQTQHRHRYYRQTAHSHKYMGATTGAGASDNSIHQSAGDRDSRGNPKSNKKPD